MDVNSAWLQELEHPTEAFFAAFAARVESSRGAEEAAREAVEKLVPLVDWAAYLPHVPHGLLGLWAVFRLRPLLEPSSFLRVLATQLHAFAHEGRGRKFRTLGQGSGHWGNLRMAIEGHHPSIAWGEAMGIAHVEAEDFRRIRDLVSADMANVGHKAVMAHRLGELHQALGSTPGVGRRLLGIAAWLAASEPCDFYWKQRIQQRLGNDLIGVPQQEASMEFESLAKVVCEAGLVALLDYFAARLRGGIGSADLLAALVLAASWKQLDARRDLEGKTSWNFAYLATVAEMGGDPCPWGQAAALVNLFPSEEEASRLRPRAPARIVEEAASGLQEALLDGEAPEAMHYAASLLEAGKHEEVLCILAETAAQNDPAFNHSHHVLAVASAAELLPRLPGQVRDILLVALIKLLANSQGSCDLGRMAQAQLHHP